MNLSPIKLSSRTIQSLALIGLLSLNLSACTTDPVPKGYTGSLSKIRDSMKRRGEHSIDLFYVEKINGRSIENSLTATEVANSGQGLAMDPVLIERNIRSEEETFAIVGRTHYAMPILEIASKVFRISGDVHFTPKPDESYVVRGELRDDYSAVWIEEAYTGTLVGQKIEVNGSTALGLLQK